ncbi:hypothetical protein JCM3766R1_001120 [Sporobolomyces carnicolor]
MFLPKPNKKRPHPDPSQRNVDDRSPPPPPSGSSLKSRYGNGPADSSGAPRGGAPVGTNGRPRSSFPPPASSAGTASTRSSSILQGASTSHSGSISRANALPFPADAALKAKLESILSQILQLLKLQSQTLEATSTTKSSAFDFSDLASEEAEELKKLWDDGLRQVSERDRKQRDTLGTTVVDNLGGLLMQLVDRVGTDLADKKIEVLKRQVDALKSQSTATATTPKPEVFPEGPSTSTATSTSTDKMLSSALSRIRQLEESLAESDRDRKQLRRELDEKDKAFELRLSALENRTTDPRRRVASVTGIGASPSPAASAQTQGSENLDHLRREVELLKTRVEDVEAKGKKDGEDAGGIGKEPLQRLLGFVEGRESPLQIAQTRIRHLEEAVRSLNVLAEQISTSPGITELESNLLRGLHEFLSSTFSEPNFASLSLGDFAPLLRDRLISMADAVEAISGKIAKLESADLSHVSQLAVFREGLDEVKRLLSDSQAKPPSSSGTGGTENALGGVGELGDTVKTDGTSSNGAG